MLLSVSIITNTIIYCLFLKYFEYRYAKRFALRKILLFTLVFIAFLSLINTLKIPMINLFFNIIGFYFIDCLFYIHSSKKNYLFDFLYFIIFIIIDSVCFFIVGLIYDGIGINVMIFRSLSSVVLLIFISFLLNHYIQSILLNFGLKHVPKSEFVVFFFITLFNLYLIFILSKDYDLLKNKISEFITFLTVIGIVLCDIAIIHYLEYMDKSYRLEKKLLLEQEHIKLQSQYYFDLKNNLAYFKQIIHDYKNHYQVIYTALINGNLSLAEKTMKKLDIEYDKMKMKFDTGIEILDIILSDKLKMAKKYNILLEYMGEATLIDFMQDFEIITIFGNILDNAIEANIATKSSNKFIKLHIYNVKEMILIKLINSCENKLEYSKEILKSSKSNDRGIGMINVRNAIERYDGDFTIAIENEVCTTLISVPSLE